MKHLKDEGYVATLDALGDIRVQLSELAGGYDPFRERAISALSGLNSNLADKWQYLRRDHDELIKSLGVVSTFIPSKE